MQAKILSYPGKIEVLNRDIRKQDKIEKQQNAKLPIRQQRVVEQEEECEINKDAPPKVKRALQKQLAHCQNKVTNTKRKKKRKKRIDKPKK